MEANKIYSSEIWVCSRLGANMEANSILILYMEGSPKMEVDKTYWSEMGVCDISGANMEAKNIFIVKMIGC